MVKEMERELRTAEEEVMEEGDTKDADDAEEKEMEETNENDEEGTIDDDEIESFIALF